MTISFLDSFFTTSSTELVESAVSAAHLQQELVDCRAVSFFGGCVWGGYMNTHQNDFYICFLQTKGCFDT